MMAAKNTILDTRKYLSGSSRAGAQDIKHFSLRIARIKIQRVTETLLDYLTCSFIDCKCLQEADVSRGRLHSGHFPSSLENNNSKCSSLNEAIHSGQCVLHILSLLPIEMYYDADKIYLVIFSYK